MAVLASGSITVAAVVDLKGCYRYYLLQSSTLSTPDTPTEYPPSAPWTDTEPSYTSGSTSSLYFVDCNVFSNFTDGDTLSDGTFYYSSVSLSSSYEAAKEAYNKALAAQNAANNASVLANGKTAVYYSEDEPSSETYTLNTNDLWFKIVMDDDGNVESYTPYYWNGEAWTLVTYGSDAIAAGAITAGKIAVADLSALGATIGGFTITDSAIYNGLSTLTPEFNGGSGVYLGHSGFVSAVDADTLVRIAAGFIDAYGYDEDQAQKWYLELQPGIGTRFALVDGKSLDYSVGAVYGPTDCELPGNLRVYGSIYLGGGSMTVKETLRATVTITPTAADTLTGKAVTFTPTFSRAPLMTVTPVSSTPSQITALSVYNVSSEGATIYLVRTNTTNTGVNWIAVY